MSFVIGELARGRFHEITRGANQSAGDAAVEGQFGATNRVDDHAGGIGRVPYLKFQFAIERDIAKGRAFHPDVTPLAIFEPRHVIARSDMGLLIGKFVIELAGHGVGLGNFFRFQALALQHVHEVGVTTEVELVSAIHTNAPFPKEVCENPMRDGGANLGFNIVTDDRQMTLFEPPLPIWLGSDEHRDAIDEGAARFENLFHVPLGGHL